VFDFARYRRSSITAARASALAESQTLAQKLLDAGFPKVTVLHEGLGVWKAKGHPVVAANAPKLDRPDFKPADR